MYGVKGNAVILYVKDGSLYYPVACSKDVTVSTSLSLLEASPKSSGPWKRFVPERLEGDISGNGLVTLDQTTVRSTYDLQALQFNQTQVVSRVIMTDNGGASVVYDYSGYITGLTLKAQSLGTASYSYSIKITGQVTAVYTPSNAIIDSNADFLVDSNGDYLTDYQPQITQSLSDFLAADFAISDFN